MGPFVSATLSAEVILTCPARTGAWIAGWTARSPLARHAGERPPRSSPHSFPRRSAQLLPGLCLAELFLYRQYSAHSRAVACDVPFLTSEAGASAGPTACDGSESYFHTHTHTLLPGRCFRGGFIRKVDHVGAPLGGWIKFRGHGLHGESRLVQSSFDTRVGTRGPDGGAASGF